MIYARMRFLASGSVPGAQPGRPAAALREMDLEAPCSVDVALRARVVAGPAVGVDAVRVGIQLEAALGQEREVDLQVARRPVRHRSDVPVAAVAARHRDVVADLA